MAADYHNAHKVDKDKLDPKLNGPFLDDIRAAEEETRREARYKANKEANRKRIEKVAKASGLEVENLREALFRDVAKQVDDKILKDPLKVRTTDAHNPRVVGRVPRNPGEPRKPSRPQKSVLPTEIDSIPPVSTEAEEKATKKAAAGNRRRENAAAKKAAKKSSVAKKAASGNKPGEKKTVKKQAASQTKLTSKANIKKK